MKQPVRNWLNNSSIIGPSNVDLLEIWKMSIFGNLSYEFLKKQLR